jgi:hypothetical protein
VVVYAASSVLRNQPFLVSLELFLTLLSYEAVYGFFWSFDVALVIYSSFLLFPLFFLILSSVYDADSL